MNKMIPLVQALVGRGVSFRVERRNTLTVNASASVIEDVDLTVLRRGRNLLISISKVQTFAFRRTDFIYDTLEEACSGQVKLFNKQP